MEEISELEDKKLLKIDKSDEGSQIRIAKISIKELREILRHAEEYDLDDELSIDYNERYKSITLYLNEHAWRMFESILNGAEAR